VEEGAWRGRESGGAARGRRRGGVGVQAYGLRLASVGRPEGIVSFVNYSKIFKWV
jgi:hypothetical protein